MKYVKEGDSRCLKTVELVADMVVVGGGLAGVCAAITAAREGIRVILVQDRPVLGGNASSEVRLWALGATSHMGNNNRWAREGGVINEIFVENVFRNPEGNPLLFDALLLDLVTREKQITLLLNTAVQSVSHVNPVTIASVEAYNAQNETHYLLSAALFCDASGDGIVGHLAGAIYRMGAESQEEFGERFASSADYGEYLGHSIFLYSRDIGRPVKYIPPGYALQDVPSSIPRFRQIRATDTGCQFWWLEYGGRLDTIHDTEIIKWEIWKVVHGVWNYIKNSGNFPEAENLTLEWVGNITGKRESRRFEGDTWIVQQDVVEQRRHADAVSYGGWAMDLHPADGVYSALPGCTQWHSKGVYQIPYRTMYSKNISNLFLAGRIISASHVAFGSSRVMATCGHGAQAVGMAAAMCIRGKKLPRDVVSAISELQMRLLCKGQHIPGLSLNDPADLARKAEVVASSELVLNGMAEGGEFVALDSGRAMLLPVCEGRMPKLSFLLERATATTLYVQLKTSEKEGNFTPDVLLAQREITLAAAGRAWVDVDFDVAIDKPRYVFVCLMQNPHVQVALSDLRVTGVLSLVHGANKKVAKKAIQSPPAGIGVDSFEFWIPERRPGGKNLAMRIEGGLNCFRASSVTNGIARPVMQPNAWVANVDDPKPSLTLIWKSPVTLSRIELSFDTDWDHAMESVQWGHAERAMPFCVDQYCIRNAEGQVIYACLENHQTRNTIQLDPAVRTDKLTLEVVRTHGAPAALFEIRCYA